MKGLWICLILNVVYELLKWSYYVGDQTHRLYSFRYIFLLAVGIYAAKGYRFKKLSGILITVVGLLFIGLTTYGVYTPRIITSWTGTSFLASMWIVPMMVWMIQNVHIRCKALEVIGRATYNIFLVQMVYYSAYYPKLSGKMSRSECLIVGIVICMSIGIVFYLLESRLTNAVINGSPLVLKQLKE